MQLVLDTKGISVKKRNNCFFLTTDKHERLISPLRVSSIAVTAHCTINSSAIRLAIEHGIPIYFIDMMGKVEGRLWTGEFGNLSTYRRYQVWFQEKPEAIRWVVELFTLKIERQTENLISLMKSHKRQNEAINRGIQTLRQAVNQLKTIQANSLKEVSASILGIEGSAARAYWQAIALCMPPVLKFEDRNRHPATDKFNALLNYMYGMLYGLIETAIFTAGLDPYLGIFHADQYNKPTLSYDLIEPFRPWADALLIDGAVKWELKDYFFEAKEKGICLTKTGKAFLIPIVNQYWAERVLAQHKNIQRKAHINRMVYDLVETLKNTFEKR